MSANTSRTDGVDDRLALHAQAVGMSIAFLYLVSFVAMVSSLPGAEEWREFGGRACEMVLVVIFAAVFPQGVIGLIALVRSIAGMSAWLPPVVMFGLLMFDAWGDSDCWPYTPWQEKVVTGCMLSLMLGFQWMVYWTGSLWPRDWPRRLRPGPMLDARADERAAAVADGNASPKN